VAFKVARRWFIESRKLDMQELAVELGISRATLFRWVGNRDVLMAEILWSMAERVFNDVASATQETGARRIAAIVAELAVLALLI
jgi:AcrR family transcriptional regulator